MFSNEVKDLPKWNPQNEKMQEEIIQFFAAVTMDLRRTNEIQRQKINQQEKRIRQLEKRANEFVMFRDKAKHPFRTIWKKIISIKGTGQMTEGFNIQRDEKTDSADTISHGI